METPKQLAPKQDILRELYLKSGNLCAFPNCDAILMDKDGTFAAQICHIEGAEPGGERFNPSMTNEERRAFPNLMLLCYRHHQVTNDIERYNVVLLKAMRAAHEHRYARPDRSMLEKLARAKWYRLVGAGSIAGLSINSLAQQIKSLLDTLMRPGRGSAVEPQSIRKELLNVLRYGPRGTVHCYSRYPLHLAVGEVLIELSEKSGWYIDRQQASLPRWCEDTPDYDNSMLMLFTIREPHQHSNARATIDEFFSTYGFKPGLTPSTATKGEGERVLTFYVPVAVKPAR